MSAECFSRRGHGTDGEKAEFVAAMSGKSYTIKNNAGVG